MNTIPPQQKSLLPTPNNQPPSREKLEKLLRDDSGDGEMVELVKSLIERHKLPYEIGVIINENRAFLMDTLSPGEVYLNQFITVDEDTIKMKSYAQLMAKSPYEVLITGETGTGKEIIAKSMIANRQGTIKAVNCAGFPRELIESELFGYLRGSFTGASSDRDGLLTSAKDGIMFLDEIGELPIDVQAKLLRALQDKKIRKVGSVKEEDINCKFVCATHRNLRDMVKEGLFRKDLYARISTLEIDIKPLRDRMCDCVPIAESIQYGKKFLERYQTELLQGKLDLSLNVRSLQQAVIRFNVLGKIQLI